jgi:hypothetical protein
LVVGTWNLENLFRPSGDAGPRDEPSYEAKLAELARVIGAIDPDVLAVQEVGDPTRSRTCAGASAATGTSRRQNSPTAAESGLGSCRGSSSPGFRTCVTSRRGWLPSGRRRRRHAGRDGSRRAARARDRRRPRRRPDHRPSEVQAADLSRASDSNPGTRTSVHALPATPCIAGRRRRSRCAPMPTGSSKGRGVSAPSSFSATSTTSRAQPPPRSCWARRDRKSVRLASIATTRATAGGSGTSRRGSRAAALQSAVSRSRRTNRPSAGQPSARPPCRRSRNRSRSSSLDHRGSDQPPGRSRVGSPSGVGSLRPGLTARTSPVQTRLARTIPVRWPLGGVSAICIWSWLTRGGRIPARVRDARRRPGPALISLSGQKVAHYLNEVHSRPWAAGT